jgi:hypothetical protein
MKPLAEILYGIVVILLLKGGRGGFLGSFGYFLSSSSFLSICFVRRYLNSYTLSFFDTVVPVQLCVYFCQPSHRNLLLVLVLLLVLDSSKTSISNAKAEGYHPLIKRTLEVHGIC